MIKIISIAERPDAASPHGLRRLQAEPAECAPENSDDALALAFAEKHADDLRFVAPFARWYVYDNGRWRLDLTVIAIDRARQLCRTAANKASSSTDAKGLASAKTVAAVERLSRSDRRLAATAEQWDADLFLLNTPDWVIDLRDGTRREHRADDYLTKATAVAPSGACPRWLQFIGEVTGGDHQLADYLQRVVGYCLTGDTTEHALFFFYGTGANGKTVFLSALGGVLSDYHRVAPIETFTASMNERHPTELAMLRGARLVTAVETEEGRCWAESRIKALTGGDRITARFMRQDFFEYVPQFKLLIAGNHKPSLRTVDEAIRRRIHMVPFTVTIPIEQRDPKLGEKLKAEWPGILQWALDGHAAWRKIGLAPPEAVTKATAAYLDAEDAVSLWIEERCERNGEDSLASLFLSWRAWAESNGEQPRANKWLAQVLESRRFTSYRTKKGRKIVGLRVICPSSDGSND